MNKDNYIEIRNKILFDIISILIILISPASLLAVILYEKRSYDYIGFDGLFMIAGVLFFIIAPIIYGLWWLMKDD